MSEELDRRIAVEVMGEPEPQGASTMYGMKEAVSNSLAWEFASRWNVTSHINEMFFQPLPFSSDLDLAMRAVDKQLGEDAFLFIVYSGEAFLSWNRWSVSIFGTGGEGSTLPEAICNLLLALVAQPMEEKR